MPVYTVVSHILHLKFSSKLTNKSWLDKTTNFKYYITNSKTLVFQTNKQKILPVRWYIEVKSKVENKLQGCKILSFLCDLCLIKYKLQKKKLR